MPTTPALEPFIRSVIRQITASGGHDGQGDRDSEARIVRLIRAAQHTVGHAHLAGDPADPAHELAADAHLTAAFFQNIDVLYATEAVEADAVAALIMRALTILGGPGPLHGSSA